MNLHYNFTKRIELAADNSRLTGTLKIIKLFVEQDFPKDKILRAITNILKNIDKEA